VFARLLVSEHPQGRRGGEQRRAAERKVEGDHVAVRLAQGLFEGHLRAIQADFSKENRRGRRNGPPWHELLPATRRLERASPNTSPSASTISRARRRRLRATS